MNEFKPWLKSMQNGSIGEVRTKSFLIDRFWILERSVDIHGADFLIQRRLHERNILDVEPPRFGVVQSKFSQDQKTYHYINKEWILDEDSESQLEFFLLIHTGEEEQRKMFLLNSCDISEDFEINSENKFVVPSQKVFASSKYQITNRKNSLDRIENSIECAEFYKNRFFIASRLLSLNPDFDAILPAYKEEIEHWSGNIPELFKKQKQEAFEALLTIEEIHAFLKGFIESIDPIEACYIAERFCHHFGRSIPLPEIFSKDFYYGAKNFKEMVDNMRNDGILDNYISARKCITDKINSFLKDYSTRDIESNTIHEIRFQYNPISFEFRNISNSMSTIPEKKLFKDFSKFEGAKEGIIIYSWKLGITVDQDGYVKMNDCCINDIMEKVYALKYYEGEEIIGV
jgi:hypothetical protein